ncbi:MAG: thermonuclease family protein [Ferruginibacter sp.]
MKLPKIAICWLLLLLLSFKEGQQGKLPAKFQGKVTAVKDGDTIEVLYEKSTVMIRLAHIDCPEVKKHQPFGQAAKKFTSGICFGQMVTVENEGKFDRYKRLIAVIINNNNENVNKALVKAGLAWHFLKYSTDNSYDELEAVARKNKIGLWADEHPTPPWQWRKP